jgi:hypothetical protein
MVGGDWTKSEISFRGYPESWISASASRGLANWEMARPVLTSKYMSLSPLELSRRGRPTRSARTFDGS